jgi:hypothetical protein
MTSQQNGPPREGGGGPNHQAASHTTTTGHRQKASTQEFSAASDMEHDRRRSRLQESHADLGLVDDGHTVGGEAS